MRTITPHLWFDREARDAAKFYVSVFPGSQFKSVHVLHNTPSGDCDVVSFELAGSPFLAISAGPLFKPNPSISFHVKLGTEAVLDEIWRQLAVGGTVLMPLDRYAFSERYGWVQDRFGVSWQLNLKPGPEVCSGISPVLMYVGKACGKAEEAIQSYAAAFGANSSVNVQARYSGQEPPNREGTVKHALFQLRGQDFGAMDSALTHNFAFNEAISLLVPCDTQAEIDELWSRLAADPEGGQCGWIKDRYGVSWQIGPAGMDAMLGGVDAARTARVMQAFLRMKKIDLATLRRAFEGD